MRKNAVLLVLATLATSMIVGCATAQQVEEEPVAPMLCDPNPEIGTQLRRGGWDGNGTNLNGASLTGSRAGSGSGWDLNGRRLGGGGWDANGDSLAGVTLPEAVDLRAGQLIGFGSATIVGSTVVAKLRSGESIPLVIADAETKEDGITRYKLTQNGVNVCADGEGGIFLPGTWDEKAARHSEGVSFSCMNGALAKCATWGYAPWSVGGPDVHQACTRLVRADYCGTGVSYTKNGTLIDVYDARGIGAPITDDASAVFEAGWGVNGAVCVNRPRFDSRSSATGAAKLPSCWSSLPSCTTWSEAQTKGSTMGNSSKLQSRVICDGK